jgi:hypothetical protein
MAITLVQQPAGVFNLGAGSSADVLFSRAKLVSSYTTSSIAQTNFKYLVQIDENGTQIFEAYVSPNPSNALVFDMSPIVKGRVKAPDAQSNTNNYSIHRGNGVLVNKCTDNQNIYSLNIGEVYEVDGVLTEFPDLNTNGFLIINGAQDYKDYFSDLGGVQLNLQDYSCNYTAPIELKKGFLTKVNKDTYIGTERNDYWRVLSTSTTMVPTRVTDLGRMAWIHDSIYVNNDVVGAKYSWFNAAGTQLATATIDVTSATYGGQALNSTDPIGKVQAIPCHWGSMAQEGLLIGAYTNAYDWTYYTIQLIQTDDNIANSKWGFYKECSGNKNEQYQLAWTNGVGFWDYYTFTPKAEHEESVEKKQYSTNVGSYSSADFQIFKYEASTKNYQITPKRSWTLASGKIDENLSMYLKDILKARQVQLIGPDGSVLPVIVDTQNTKFFKDRTNNLYDFQVKVTLAQSIEA